MIAFPLDFQLTEIYLLTRLGAVKSTIKMLASEGKRARNRGSVFGSWNELKIYKRTIYVGVGQEFWTRRQEPFPGCF